MTTIDNPLDPTVQAIFVRAHLRCIAAGMSPSRGVRKGSILQRAGELTGQEYKRREYGKAIADLTQFIAASREGTK